MAFLEVITRTFGERPGMLQRNLDSLAALSDPDWQRTVILDDARRGVAWAVGNLRNVEATGEWVWVLDDDDRCMDRGLVGLVKKLARSETGQSERTPDVVMVRCYHARFGMLPSTANWQREPVRGNIGTSNYIVRREVWNATRDLWRELYDGDYWYIKALWERRDLRFAWLPTMAAFYPQQSLGAAEPAAPLASQMEAEYAR